MPNSILPIVLFQTASGEERLVSVASTKRTGIKRLLSAMMLAMAALGGTQWADASIVTTTITGTVNGGVDNTGIFGPPSELNGQNFKLVFTFDDTKGKQESSFCSTFITNEGAAGAAVQPRHGCATNRQLGHRVVRDTARLHLLVARPSLWAVELGILISS